MQQPELPTLPPRPLQGHKGTFGKIMLIGGSSGMSGAVCLAGKAALRSGAGLVYLAVPEPIQPLVAAFEPSYLTIPLDSDDFGRIAADERLPLERRLEGMHAAGIGPGLGLSAALDEIVWEVYLTAPCPMVFDADALNSLAHRQKFLTKHETPRILTPHPGEFSRLTGHPLAEVQQHRAEMAAEFARQHQVILVLKGAGTVVTDGESLIVNSTGNPGMGTGGSGDVLTGMLTALIGLGLEPLAAAHLGVYAHGLAGDIAAEKYTQTGMIASDLLESIPLAWKQLEQFPTLDPSTGG